uniref:SET domain-containing protein n=1 Tax=Mesocestoides corti TaxID=53468 RepID=A0A5K3FCA9_MESCO
MEGDLAADWLMITSMRVDNRKHLRRSLRIIKSVCIYRLGSGSTLPVCNDCSRYYLNSSTRSRWGIVI